MNIKTINYLIWLFILTTTTSFSQYENIISMTNSNEYIYTVKMDSINFIVEQLDSLNNSNSFIVFSEIYPTDIIYQSNNIFIVGGKKLYEFESSSFTLQDSIMLVDSTSLYSICSDGTNLYSIDNRYKKLYKVPISNISNYTVIDLGVNEDLNFCTYNSDVNEIEIYTKEYLPKKIRYDIISNQILQTDIEYVGNLINKIKDKYSNIYYLDYMGTIYRKYYLSTNIKVFNRCKYMPSKMLINPFNDEEILVNDKNETKLTKINIKQIDYSQLIFPNGNELPSKYGLEFVWSNSDQADNYEFQISKLNNYSIIEESKTVSLPFVQIDSLSYNSSYYWRIKCSNTFSSTTWTESNSFTIIDFNSVSFNYPLNSSTLTGNLTEFEWSNTIGNFQVQYTSDSIFTDSTLISKTITNDYLLKTASLYYNTDYLARIRRIDRNNFTIWSPEIKFTTPSPPIPSIINLPNNGDGVGEDTKLSWDQNSCSNFRLQISSDQNFNNLLFNNVIKGNEISNLTLENKNTLFYRVRTEYGHNYSDWSTLASMIPKVSKLEMNEYFHNGFETDFPWFLIQGNWVEGASTIMELSKTNTDPVEVVFSKNIINNDLNNKLNINNNSLFSTASFIFVGVKLEESQTYTLKVQQVNETIYGEPMEYTFEVNENAKFNYLPLVSELKEHYLFKQEEINNFSENIVGEYQFDMPYKMYDNNNEKISAIWNNTYINFGQDFELEFFINFGSDDDNGGGGIALVFQNEGFDFHVDDPIGLGWSEHALSEPPINRLAFAIEFDTYSNYLDYNPVNIRLEPDIISSNKDCDHLSAHISNQRLENVRSGENVGTFNEQDEYVELSENELDVEDGYFHCIKVRWNIIAKTLTVSFDNEQRNIYHLSSAQMDKFLIDNKCIWGFTGASGYDYKNIQLIKLPKEIKYD